MLSTTLYSSSLQEHLIKLEWYSSIFKVDLYAYECYHELYLIQVLVFVFQDPDDTLKRKTFELLYTMTKSTNVEVIVDRMIEYMISITDHHYKTYIASRCVKLAEEFAPNNHWFIQVFQPYILFCLLSNYYCCLSISQIP